MGGLPPGRRSVRRRRVVAPFMSRPRIPGRMPSDPVDDPDDAGTPRWVKAAAVVAALLVLALLVLHLTGNGLRGHGP